MTLTTHNLRFLRTMGRSAHNVIDPQRRAESVDAWSGYFGDYAWTFCRKGLGYTPPATTRSGRGYDLNAWSHSMTWADVDRWRAQQPAHLLHELRDALEAESREAHRHWDAMHTISPFLYRNCPPELRTQLDTEFCAHLATDAAIGARIDAALSALLDGVDEPADLIEWAETLT